ncbi:DUF2079 domain-containing protein [Actinocorallia lasiicapitis]
MISFLGRHRAALFTSALSFLVTAAVALQQWYGLRLAGFDLGIFDQGVRSYAEGELPRSIIKNFHHEFPPSFSLLGDHFSPVLALLAPGYWVWDDPRILLIGQSLLFASGVPLVRSIARDLLGESKARFYKDPVFWAGMTFGLGWPLLVASRNGFHEVGFAVPILLLMLRAGLRGNRRMVLVWALALCCVKEDLGMVVGCYGLVLLLRHRRERKWRWTGVALLFGGPAITVITIQWIIPAFGGVPGYYWNYGALGSEPSDVIHNLLTQPWILWHASTDATLKPLLLLWLFGTLAFLPLGSLTTLCALPLLGERIFSDNPNHWSIARQYDAFLWPILVVAAIETVARFRHRPQTKWIASAAVAFNLMAAVPFGVQALFDELQWRPNKINEALVEGAENIPRGSTIEADNQIAPRLTAGNKVVIVDGKPRGMDYVLIRTNRRSFPFGDVSEQADRVRLLLAHGYRVIWANDGVALLKRYSKEPIPGEYIPGEDSVPVRELVPGDVGHNLFKG